MATPERVTLREYDTTNEAKAAEKLLLANGFTSEEMLRTGKKLSVVPRLQEQAEFLLATDTTVATSNSATETVQQAASSVVDTAQSAATAVADTVQDATSTVTSAVDKVADSAADKVQTLANTVRQGASADAPAIQRQTVQGTAKVLDKTSQYLRQGDLHVVLNDLRGTIRRNPVRSLLVGLGLGYLARGSLFGAAGTQTQPTPSRSTYAPSTPTYATSADVGYDTSYGTASTTTDYPTDLGTTADVAGYDEPIMNDQLADDMLYGTDDDMGGDTLAIIEIDTVIDDVSDADLTTLTETELGGTDSISGMDTMSDMDMLDDTTTGGSSSSTTSDFGSAATEWYNNTSRPEGSTND